MWANYDKAVSIVAIAIDSHGIKIPLKTLDAASVSSVREERLLNCRCADLAAVCPFVLWHNAAAQRNRRAGARDGSLNGSARRLVVGVTAHAAVCHTAPSAVLTRRLRRKEDWRIGDW